jgi:hypothetical protein
LCAFEKGNAQGAHLVMPSMHRFAIQKRLAETEERIALGQRQVAQQQELIVKLEADGQSAAHAKYLLAGLQLLQAARLDSRDKLLKRLDKAR